MSDPVRVLAADLGATSVRVGVVELSADRPSIEILHRHPHSPVRGADGTLRWDWERIVSEVVTGLERGLDDGPVDSIGVDGWAVDYGLLDGDGSLLSAPHSYRSERTAGWRSLVDRVGAEQLYRVTGIQLMAINTIFQLAAHDRDELARAEHLLLLPDLLVHHLTGRIGAERSNASTTGLLTTDGTWSAELAAAASVDPGILPSVGDAGDVAGTWRGVPVSVVGSHDTASAFLAAAAPPGTAVVSSGTWALVGTERPDADTGDLARRANFSNEASAFGGVRFLRNVPGMWLVEECRRQWGASSTVDLLAAAAGVSAPGFDPTGERFLAPTDMAAEIRGAAGLPDDAPPAVVVRAALEAIALGIDAVLDDLGAVTGHRPEALTVVGGGAGAMLLNHLIGERTGVGIRVGPTEATALGNAAAQGVAIGYFASVTEARRWLDGATEML